MAKGLPHPRVNRSRRVRVLTDLSVAEVPEAKQSVAEKLGLWLDFTEAVSLFSVLSPGPDGDWPEQGSALENTVMGAEYDRVRRLLTDSIMSDGVFNAGVVRIKLPTPAPNASVESAADFSPYHRYYLAHQRDMNAQINPLRVQVRNALTGHSPVLKRLAALDAVLDGALATRERNLLSMLPLLVAKRFEHLFKTHQAARSEISVQDDPASWMQPGEWLFGFCRDMQAVLLAELEIRMEPVAGLIEALSHEETKS